MPRNKVVKTHYAPSPDYILCVKGNNSRLSGTPFTTPATGNVTCQSCLRMLPKHQEESRAARELEGLRKLAGHLQRYQMTPVVDDDFPQVQHVTFRQLSTLEKEFGNFRRYLKQEDIS